MSRKIRVKMGEYRIGQDDNVLSALGIGSCVAVCLYDDTTGIGGLAHIMLPDDSAQPEKAAPTLVMGLIQDMEAVDAVPGAMTAKLFGGASLLSTSMEIGKENVAAVTHLLSDQGIPVIAEDTGGDTGRSIWLNCRTGDVVVQKPFGPTERY